MDRKVETTLFKILDLVTLLRDEDGAFGKYARQELADILETPPTAEEVRAYLDRCKDSGGMTIENALSQAKSQDEVEEVWFSVRNDEKPLPNPRCPNANEAIGIYLRANKFDRDLSMPQARKFALALLDAPNVSAQDVERMIGEL